MRAGNYYRNGYNCAKSTYLAVNDAISKKPNQKILKACTCFGGGIGKCGSVCGALIGAELAVGAQIGTTKPDNGSGKSGQAYKSSAELFNNFKDEFGSVDCSKLNHGDFSSKEHIARCERIVSKATAMATRIIKKKLKKKAIKKIKGEKKKEKRN